MRSASASLGYNYFVTLRKINWWWWWWCLLSVDVDGRICVCVHPHRWGKTSRKLRDIAGFFLL